VNNKVWINGNDGPNSYNGWTSPKDYITEVPDFPVKGVNFKDISPLLANRKVFRDVIYEMGRLVGIEPTEPPYFTRYPDYWIGIDARGFIFASALSYEFGGGVVMCRKEGKLPPTVFSHSYSTEYSEDTIQIKQGDGTAVIVDDVLATGGTLQATNHLAETAGYNVVDNLVLIDLLYVTRTKTFDLEVKSLIQYE
jgi:adenine phosphoribosyltransferase|tara:strand:- start:228 stop:812 length:585 start_codon:yes stop_codon:yes gene_type:complete